MSQTDHSLWQAAVNPTEPQSVTDVVVQVNGQPVMAKSSDTVATALIRAGYTHFGVSSKTGFPLSPGCLMGVCFGCVCTIDGRPGTQACLEPVREGLVITTERSDQ